MMKIHRQRGSLMIVVVILIVVVSLMATTLTFLVVEDARSAADYLNASNALFVAESGIERGVRQFSINNSYTGEGPTTFGAGTFTINVYTTDIAGAALPITDRRINSKGIVGGAARTINATVRFGGVTLFQDPFPNITQWSTRVSNTIATCAAGNIGLNNTAGTVSYDVDTAAGSSGGSFEIEMIPRIGNHTVVIGNDMFLEEKFNKLSVFYREGLNKKGWDKYSIINLKFKDQVVCTKK